MSLEKLLGVDVPIIQAPIERRFAGMLEPYYHAYSVDPSRGHPARRARVPFSAERAERELGPMNERVPTFPRAASALGPLREAAERAGSVDFSPLWAGQGAPLCRPCFAGELTRELASGL